MEKGIFEIILVCTAGGNHQGRVADVGDLSIDFRHRLAIIDAAIGRKYSRTTAPEENSAVGDLQGFGLSGENLIKSKESSDPLRLIDIHCHILPEVDDGPKSWEVAVEMCRMAAADGITHQVATPHSNDRYHFDQKYLLGCVERLQSLAGPAPKLSLGCDFHLSYDNLQSVLEFPGRYTIAGSRYLLVELSDFSIPVQIGDWFFKLANCGVTAVITHPERNAILRQSPQRVIEWVEMGCVVQVTANALTGFWGQRVQRVANWLLEHEAVHVIASDAHDTKQRTPVLSPAKEALSMICGDDVANALSEGNPRAILEGQPLPYFPKPAVK